jgi:hypothetical protein
MGPSLSGKGIPPWHLAQSRSTATLIFGVVARQHDVEELISERDLA